MTTSEYLQLSGVLNKLAGTTTTPLSPAGAANIWAGITNRANWLDLLGALNYKNGWRSNNSKPYLSFSGVCNQLAGTTGREGLSALNKLAGTGP